MPKNVFALYVTFYCIEKHCHSENRHFLFFASISHCYAKILKSQKSRIVMTSVISNVPLAPHASHLRERECFRFLKARLHSCHTGATDDFAAGTQSAQAPFKTSPIPPSNPCCSTQSTSHIACFHLPFPSLLRDLCSPWKFCPRLLYTVSSKCYACRGSKSWLQSICSSGETPTKFTLCSA